MTTLADELRSRPFHLALSAGWFGFYAHAGFLLALEEAGLRPASWSGTSAGAIAAALGAAGLDAATMRAELLRLRRRDFWDPGFGLGLLRGRKLARKIAGLAPVALLEETREPVLISVLDLGSRRLRVLREGSLAEAVRAATAIFPLFMPARLPWGRAADGGGRDRAALAGVAAGRLVLLHDLRSRSGRVSPIVRDDLDLRRISVADLPRLGPFRMDRGEEALERALTETRRLLAEPPRPVLGRSPAIQ